MREQAARLLQEVEDSSLASFIGKVVVMVEEGGRQNNLGDSKGILICCQLFPLIRN